MKIDSVSAAQIFDTRSKPTIEVTLGASFQGQTLESRASVPSGKSTGSHEALELRDADGGMRVAIVNVEDEIAALLTSHEWSSADEIDIALIALDGTPNKSRLGANAILGVSIAAQRLFAQAAGVPLWKAIAERAHAAPAAPRLYLNFMNGGVHVHPAEALAKEGGFPLPFQEYILVVGGKTSEALPVAQETFSKLGVVLKSNFNTEVPMGDEGGYAPHFDSLEQPFELLDQLVTEFPGTSIAIDAAASELRRGDSYHLLGHDYSANELAAMYRELVGRFPLHSIEDPFSEDAIEDFAKLTAELSSPSTKLGATTILVVGDDFTVTNPKRIEAARAARAINAVLIKPNQIGSVKEAIEAVRLTHANGWATVCSHRSGETDDTFIADFAYGVGAYGIKAGGLGQKERLEKYERLIAIEKEAGTV